jgi:hypothetical protein
VGVWGYFVFYLAALAFAFVVAPIPVVVGFVAALVWLWISRATSIGVVGCNLEIQDGKARELRCQLSAINLRTPNSVSTVGFFPSFHSLVQNLALVFLNLAKQRVEAGRGGARANLLLTTYIQESTPSARGGRLWVLPMMEISKRDTLILHIFGSIRRWFEAGGNAWGGGFGPNEEMLATVAALRAIWSSWREEVRVSNPKLRIGNSELA